MLCDGLLCEFRLAVVEAFVEAKEGQNQLTDDRPKTLKKFIELSAFLAIQVQ
jgi:hypothetical protein